MNAAESLIPSQGEFILRCKDETQTRQAASALASICVAGDCITLEGDLGAGKTAFARGFIQALAGQECTVTSPTFTLVQSYMHLSPPIWHYDFYRLETPSEVRETGLEEALEHAVTLIEWPDIAAAYLPQERVRIKLEMQAEGTRRLVISGEGRAMHRIHQWQEAMHGTAR